MGRTTQSPELYVSTVSPPWKCNLILYTSQACPPRLTGPVPIQYSTPHTLPSAVTSETWKMSSPYTNLSTEVQTAITELESDSSTYQPQNANELLKIVDRVRQPRPEESADVSPGEADCSQEPDVVTPRAPTGR